ncbi:MAG: flagellar biosynthetic protein FliO [Parasphingorhabdus sp.]|uniref:flagellar biosynthetic protein FliO n=1 Tax=Parasphingorhabdus sp. TaxID=2709688 RepID=UPI003003251D
MTAYIIKLLVFMPLMGGLIYAALWSYRKYQPRLLSRHNVHSMKILETLPIGTFGRLVLIEFDGREILLSATRGRVERVAEKTEAS